MNFKKDRKMEKMCHPTTKRNFDTVGRLLSNPKSPVVSPVAAKFANFAPVASESHTAMIVERVGAG